MKILFLSNYFNHHQAPLCDALHTLTGGKFCFVETASMPREQRELGYPRLERAYLLSWENERGRVLEEVGNADVVIAGEAPQRLVRRRLLTGKLTFRYSERPLREGLEVWKILPRLLRWHWWNPLWADLYLLSTGAYTAGDYAKFGLFRGKSFRWGYFPEVKKQNRETLFSQKEPTQILWCGRLLELKHPELALEAAARLYREGYRLMLTFLGSGEQEHLLKDRVKQENMEHCVRFPGAVPQEKVAEYMEKAGIFLFTSDKREGWGAVLNEAMACGCAVAASLGPGSVPYLIKDGENGLVYPENNVEALTKKLRFLLENPEKQAVFGEKAMETVGSLWSPEEAARRLIRLSEALLRGENGRNLYAEGPCSFEAPRKKEKPWT